DKPAMPAEPEKRARAVARQASTPAQKQARPPKVQRVVKNGVEKEEPQAAQKPAQANGEDWFDELLVNLCERERQGYTPVKTESAPEVAARETEPATAEEPVPPNDFSLRSRDEQPKPAEQIVFKHATEEPAWQEPEAEEPQPAEAAAQEPDEPAVEVRKAYAAAPEQANEPGEPEQEEFSEPEQPSGESE
ncbi:MAG TPA: hypothetical protein PLR57_06505, partial [Clostridia bacterium]|nr:hypothetical protein [Clostridia bacterium]